MTSPRGRKSTAAPYVVGVDGSAASISAVRWAAERATRDGVLLVVLHVFQVNALPSVAGPMRTPAMRRTARHHGQKVLDAVAAQAPLAGEVEQLLEQGVADRVLIEWSRRAGLLVLGARPQHSRPHARFLGSTATRVLRGAECPVVMVPHLQAADTSADGAVPGPRSGALAGR